MTPAVPPAGVQPDSSVVFRALYLFAGEHRQADVETVVRRTMAELFAGLANIIIEFKCIDIIRSGEQDCSRVEVRRAILAELGATNFDIVIATPPCSSFTRAVFNRLPGPGPKRSATWPRGFPWLSPSERAHVDLVLVAKVRDLQRRRHRPVHHPRDRRELLRPVRLDRRRALRRRPRFRSRRRCGRRRRGRRRRRCLRLLDFASETVS